MPDTPDPGLPGAAATARTRLLRLLRDEGYRPGERLGGERDLAARLGLTRTALRAALEELEAAGRITRRIGRAGGVFAADGKVERNLNTVESVLTMLRRQALPVRTVVVDQHIGPPTPAERRDLRLEAPGLVVRVVRSRWVGERPWSWETSVLPSALFPQLLAHDLQARSLYDVMAEHYGRAPVQSDEQIDVVPVPDRVAAALELAAGAVALRVTRVASDADGVPVESAQDLFRADMTRIHTRGIGFRAPDRTPVAHGA